MYRGNRTIHMSTVCYHSVFVTRRFMLVLLYIAFRESSNSSILMIYGFLGIQSVYILYMWIYSPHIDNVYNILEYVNETCLILLAYMGLIFSKAFEKPSSTHLLGYISIGIVITIVFANVAGILIFAVSKLILMWKKHQAKKNASKIVDTPRKATVDEKFIFGAPNTARRKIIEEVKEEVESDSESQSQSQSVSKHNKS